MPTVDGLTSGYRNVSALTTVRISSLLDSIDTVKHNLLTIEWERAFKKSVNSLAEFRHLTHVEFFSELTPDIQQTWFWKTVLQYQLKDIEDLIQNRPIRRFLFGDGPLIMFNYGRAGYGLEVINYIKSKIFPNIKAYDLLDPFSDEKVLFPLATTVKGKNFFSLVRSNEREKDLERNS